jgi:hypothetical protein
MSICLIKQPQRHEEVQCRVFLNSALDGGGWSSARPGLFTQGKQLLVPIGYEAGWAPEPVWTLWRGEKSVAPVGNQNTIPRVPARHYTD